MSRSLRVDRKFIKTVKLALKRHGFPNQEAFAKKIEMARSTVVNFLNGKPVDFANFVQICDKLGLDWKDIATELSDEPYQPDSGDSSFYVDRPPTESNCYQAIVKSGALLRIKAPQQMGKTWLMRRVLSYAEKQGYETVTLSFELADNTVFTDLEKFSQWFCAAVGQELGLPNQLNSSWADILACNYNTTNYFQTYLLANRASPLVLALDNVDIVFEYREIAIDFCRLLRNWHDQANRGDRYSDIWQKLRLVIVHATEVYGGLDINSSPLAGVGVVVDLPEFNSEQVKDLAKRCELTCNNSHIEKLMSLVGGHPYLVQLAIERMKLQGVTLDRILETAHTEAGIYSNHLREHLGNLEKYPELGKAFREVVVMDNPVELNPVQAFKLHSMGLVNLAGNQVTPRCKLYRNYFRERLGKK
ncbi:MAG TPA: DNA-binding protein [Cyanobacteria bacterium UBA8803]|nr:DNA-binding protein [Cyanobacteria bacterium UBA9273]HBL57695.1 DNA-binding protein [Cyanobacteria bacterium UBA8803]